MNNFLENPNDGSLRFSDVEVRLAEFLKTFDPEPYKVHPSLYYFEENVFGEIVASLRNCKLPKHFLSYKDVLREKLIEKLGFSTQDLILCTDGIVYAKRFFAVEALGEGAERRACGLDPAGLEAYKQKFFPNELHVEKTLELLPYLVEEVLNFRKITPIKFKKLFITSFINLVDIIVLAYTDISDPKVVRGLSLYLLREVFDRLMLFIASDILFHFSNADRKAIEFLSFFSVNESIDAHGNRYKANPILDESNHAWNITTIRSTLLQHKKAKQAVYDKKNALISIKTKLEGFKLDQQEYALQKAKINEQWSHTEAVINGIHKTLRKVQESEDEEVRFNEDGEEKVFPRKVLITRLFKKEDKLLSERTKCQKAIDEIEQRIANKQKDIDIWEKKYAENQEVLAAFEAKGHPMDKQYERIQRALAKTLASR